MYTCMLYVFSYMQVVPLTGIFPISRKVLWSSPHCQRRTKPSHDPDAIRSVYCTCMYVCMYVCIYVCMYTKPHETVTWSWRDKICMLHMYICIYVCICWGTSVVGINTRICLIYVHMSLLCVYIASLCVYSLSLYVCMYEYMRVCMNICLFYVCVYIASLYMCVCMNICVYVWIYVCMYEYMCVCMNICVYVWIYVCMCEYMCVCMNICVYVWIYVCMYEYSLFLSLSISPLCKLK